MSEWTMGGMFLLGWLANTILLAVVVGFWCGVMWLMDWRDSRRPSPTSLPDDK